MNHLLSIYEEASFLKCVAKPYFSAFAKMTKYLMLGELNYTHMPINTKPNGHLTTSCFGKRSPSSAAKHVKTVNLLLLISSFAFLYCLWVFFNSHLLLCLLVSRIAYENDTDCE